VQVLAPLSLLAIVLILTGLGAVVVASTDKFSAFVPELAGIQRPGVSLTTTWSHSEPISPYSGRDCVKSLRSSYAGLYPQTEGWWWRAGAGAAEPARNRLRDAREREQVTNPWSGREGS